MSVLIVLLAILCEIVATILGFHWFGTNGVDWAGWVSAGLVLYFVAGLVGGVSLRRT